MVFVVLATGVMAYTANPVASSNKFRLGDSAAIVDGSGGGITGTENGVATGGWVLCLFKKWLVSCLYTLRIVFSLT